MQNEQPTIKNILTYETDQLKTKPTASIAKSTDIDAKTNNHLCKTKYCMP